MGNFAEIYEKAAIRKGGKEILEKLIVNNVTIDLASISDDRYLSEMTKRIFSAGFVWKVIESKWQDFEEVFFGFNLDKLIWQADDYWEGLTMNKKIVRNAAKIFAVRKNARFIRDIAGEHGGFGKFLAVWPKNNQIDLLNLLTKRGARLGGLTGQYFLRFIGFDAFILSNDVLGALRDNGLQLSGSATSRRGFEAIQAKFNEFQAESGLSYVNISRVLAMSFGQNHTAEEILARLKVNKV